MPSPRTRKRFSGSRMWPLVCLWALLGVFGAASIVEAQPQPPGVDLILLKEGPDSMETGKSYTYTVSILQLGDAYTGTIVLTDTIPPYMDFEALPPQGFQCDPITGTASPNGMNVVCSGFLGESTGPFEFSVIPFQPGIVTNTACVSSPSGETNLDNNCVSVATRVTPPLADLSIRKLGPAEAVLGNPFVYTVTVGVARNAAQGVVVTDTLPAGMEFEFAGGPFTCLPSQGVTQGPTEAICSTPFTVTLDPGAYTLTLWARALAPGIITNTVAVGAGNASPDGEKSSSAATDVKPGDQPAVPTLQHWGLLIFVVLMVLASVVLLRRRPERN